MYKLLIADDEEEIRNGLMHIVPWDTLGFTVVGCFASGEEVIKYLKSNVVDVALLDIVMGSISGLEVMQWIRANLPDAYIVLLSGYADFHYAQQAIRHSAYHYLLKPTNIQELMSLFRKIRSELDSKESIQTSSVLYQEALLYSLILHPSLYTSETHDSLLYQENQEKEIAVSAIQFSDQKTAQKAKKLVDTLFMRPEHWVITCITISNYLFLFIGTTSPSNSLEKQLHAVTEKSLISWNTLFETQAKLKLCIPCSSFKDLFSNPTLRSLLEEIQISRRDTFSAKIQEYYQQGMWSDLLDAVGQLTDKNPEFMLQLYLQLFFLGRKLRRPTVSYPDCLSDQTLNDTCINFRNLELLEKRCRVLVDYLKAQSHQDTCAVEEMVALCNRPHEVIPSLTEIADALEMHPSYLSRLFKEKLGVTFSSYVSNLRMKRARNLLERTTMQVQEISSFLGFQDTKYFYRVFRAAHGITPTEYRILHKSASSTANNEVN